MFTERRPQGKPDGSIKPRVAFTGKLKQVLQWQDKLSGIHGLRFMYNEDGEIKQLTSPFFLCPLQEIILSSQYINFNCQPELVEENCQPEPAEGNCQPELVEGNCQPELVEGSIF